MILNSLISNLIKIFTKQNSNLKIIKLSDLKIKQNIVNVSY